VQEEFDGAFLCFGKGKLMWEYVSDTGFNPVIRPKEDLF